GEQQTTHEHHQPDKDGQEINNSIRKRRIIPGLGNRHRGGPKRTIRGRSRRKTPPPPPATATARKTAKKKNGKTNRNKNSPLTTGTSTSTSKPKQKQNNPSSKAATPPTDREEQPKQNHALKSLTIPPPAEPIETLPLNSDSTPITSPSISTTTSIVRVGRPFTVQRRRDKAVKPWSGSRNNLGGFIS
ncbi:hypothetical protein PTTG_26368, partial [Puccinia triticina 1-1 BBBD Race 1]